MGVRRVTPLPDHTPSDVNERTVYVENLPTPSTTHDNVKKMFKTFGDVIYVRYIRTCMNNFILTGINTLIFGKRPGLYIAHGILSKTGPKILPKGL